jgi:hypothetical protein
MGLSQVAELLLVLVKIWFPRSWISLLIGKTENCSSYRMTPLKKGIFHRKDAKSAKIF